MRSFNQMLDYPGVAADSPCETLLLGRIGRELSLIYLDTLQAPLPAQLQSLVDRLDYESLAEETRRLDA